MNRNIKLVLVGGVGEKNFGKQYRQGNRIYSADAIAMALNASPVGNAGGYSYLYAVREGKTVGKDIIIYDDFNSRIRADQTCIGTITTNVGSSAPRNGMKIIEIHEGETVKANYERTGSMGATGVREVDNMGNELRIRKLTPKECFRLMGFDDTDHDVLAENGISNSQIYKMAGNSIVVDVLEAIFGNLKEQYNL